MKKNIFILLSILLFSCSHKSIQQTICLEQISTNNLVVIRGDTIKEIVYIVNFPFLYNFTNHSTKKEEIYSIDYYYSKDYEKKYMNSLSSGWSSNIWVYQLENGILLDKGLGANKKINAIKKSQTQDFLVYTAHPIDTAIVVQLELKPYLDQMKNQEKDTLSIGTFKEFKEKHPELTKMLLEGDSISFGVLKTGGKQEKESQNIYIDLPIQY